MRWDLSRGLDAPPAQDSTHFLHFTLHCLVTPDHPHSPNLACLLPFSLFFSRPPSLYLPLCSLSCSARFIITHQTTTLLGFNLPGGILQQVRPPLLIDSPSSLATFISSPVPPTSLRLGPSTLTSHPTSTLQRLAPSHLTQPSKLLSVWTSPLSFQVSRFPHLFVNC